MGKALKGISILIILAGAAGIGYAYYLSTQPSGINPIIILGMLPGLEEVDDDTGIMKTWFMLNTTQPNMYQIGIDDLVIDFVVGAGESVYFCFSGYMELDPLINQMGTMTIKFKIDGITINNPQLLISVSNFTRMYMGLQNLTQFLSPGTHNVSIDYSPISCAPVTTVLADRSLLVQTLIP